MCITLYAAINGCVRPSRLNAAVHPPNRNIVNRTPASDGQTAGRTCIAVYVCVDFNVQFASLIMAAVAEYTRDLGPVFPQQINLPLI